MAVDKNIEMKTEVKWARLLIKMVGKSRPSVVNILEGPRSFELQIWWEVSPWVSSVYPVVSRVEVENPEEEEEGVARAVKRVGFSRQNSNYEGQSAQNRKIKLGKTQGTVEVDTVFSVSGAVLNGRGGANAEGRGNKSDESCALGEGLTQQAGPGGGSNCRACLLLGLKGTNSSGLRDTISRSPAVIKAGGGLKVGLQLQQGGAHKSSSGGAARMIGLFGPELPGSLQAGPSNWIRDIKQGKRGYWGLNKGFKGARSSALGATSGSRDEWRKKEGGTSSGAEGSSDPLLDPAWICARGPLLQTKEGWPGRGGGGGGNFQF